ncbi:MAG TPA: PorV/PorQ family protein, partial [Candidatus Saccharimonadales bacterium]|nr:PorV/PorQ family protein [Candidatus Saccharimonadales bacterium]
DTDPGFGALELGPGARAQALGSAYASLADDPSASFWNPAGLARLSPLEVTATHHVSFEGIRQEYLSLAKRLSEGTLGISFGAVYNSDPIIGTDIRGDSVGTFGYYETVTTVAFGMRATKNVDAGVGVEYLADKFGDFTGSGFAVNLGLRYFPGIPNLSLGASVRHLGPGITVDTHSTPLPTTWQGGASYIGSMSQGDLTLAADLSKTRGDSRVHALFGVEYSRRGFVTLMGGYRTGFDSEAFSFGVGINLARFQVQYAVVPYKNDFGTGSRIALTYLGR